VFHPWEIRTQTLLDELHDFHTDIGFWLRFEAHTVFASQIRSAACYCCLLLLPATADAAATVHAASTCTPDVNSAPFPFSASIPSSTRPRSPCSPSPPLAHPVSRLQTRHGALTRLIAAVILAFVACIQYISGADLAVALITRPGVLDTLPTPGPAFHPV
jgi:hypothetical protein